MTPQQRIACSIILALLCLAGPGRAADDERQLRVAINTDIRSTNPGVNRDANNDTIMHHMVESLVAYGEDLQVKPLLAESIAISDDGRSYRFRLRPGVLFHNGAALTAAHVVWNWHRFLDPATQWQCRRWYTDDNDDPGTSIIVDVRAEQPDTVVFELQEPNALFLDQMANVQCPSAIVHPDSVAADGNWIEPIGTGPYRLAEWRRGEYVELRRFDQYHTPNGDADGYRHLRVDLARRKLLRLASTTVERARPQTPRPRSPPPDRRPPTATSGPLEPALAGPARHSRANKT
jgi:peptide/nickel transport system substrate-binding protein